MHDTPPELLLLTNIPHQFPAELLSNAQEDVNLRHAIGFEIRALRTLLSWSLPFLERTTFNMNSDNQSSGIDYTTPPWHRPNTAFHARCYPGSVKRAYPRAAGSDRMQVMFE